MEQVTATRSELLERRIRLDLARRGRDLLEDKRDQLLEEFRRVVDRALADEDALEQAASESRRALALAEALDGPEWVASASMVPRTAVELDTRVTTVMGVRIAAIEAGPFGRPRTERGTSAPGGTPRLDLVAERFEAEMELLVAHANHELRLRRLAEEISATTRRVNALEFVVVPQLTREARRIQMVLDERERQDRFRLKRIKGRRTRRAP